MRHVCRFCDSESLLETPRQRGKTNWEEQTALRRVLSVEAGIDVADALQGAEQAAYEDGDRA